MKKLILLGLLLLTLSSGLPIATAKTTQEPPTGFQAAAQPAVNWAFEETFDGDPTAPSQALLPQTFDYVVTHRSHPKEHFTKQFGPFPADHGSDCAGPDPAVVPLPMHDVISSHLSNGKNPDPSFYICKNHIMSAMGDVEGYSVSSFWPRQEFDFSDGGVLEFDVNINTDRPRNWWEVLIVPREYLRVSAAKHWLPIDERYPTERIVLDFDGDKRFVQIGTGALDPDGIVASGGDWANWSTRFPSDPANSDRRIRRTMRIELENNQLKWSIEKEDGSFDELVVDVPGGMPFTQGLVVFKTHAYTPTKDGNWENYTFHWDNIRFSGPVVGTYEAFEADDVAYLQANGSRPIGTSETITIDLPHIGDEPVLFGQVHNPMQGQVLLSVNGGPDFVVDPYDYGNGGCNTTGWKSFQLPLDPAQLRVGTNTFEWTIGPRPSCVESWVWNGFSIKGLEVQFDLPVLMPVDPDLSIGEMVDNTLSMTWTTAESNCSYTLHSADQPFFTPSAETEIATFSAEIDAYSLSAEDLTTMPTFFRLMSHGCGEWAETSAESNTVGFYRFGW